MIVHWEQNFSAFSCRSRWLLVRDDTGEVLVDVREHKGLTASWGDRLFIDVESAKKAAEKWAREQATVYEHPLL